MITIITDSSSEILKDLADEMNIRILPMPILIEGQEYMSGFDITNEEFYQKLKTSFTMPKTSMVNYTVFKQAFEEEVAKGNEVLAITISSKLSATYEQAHLAAKDVSESKIMVLDSLNASLGQTVIVRHAVRLRNQGKTLQQMYDELCDLRQRVHLYAAIDTLVYLKEGGRLSSTAVVIGTLLKVKPLITVREGRVEVIGKALGRPNAFKSICGYAKKVKQDETVEGVLAHACDTNIKDQLIEYLKREKISVPDLVVEIGSTIGVHIGPGAVAIAFAEEKQTV